MHQPFFARSSHSRPLRGRCDAIFRPILERIIFLFFACIDVPCGAHKFFIPPTHPLQPLDIAHRDRGCNAQRATSKTDFFFLVEKLFSRFRDWCTQVSAVKNFFQESMSNDSSRLSTALLSHSTSSSVCAKIPTPSSKRLLYPLSSSHFSIKSRRAKKNNQRDEKRTFSNKNIN